VQAIESAEGAKALICTLGRSFYALGWVSGTGGGISVRVGERVFMAPSGVQKEAMTAEMIFELDRRGEVISGPPREWGLQVSQCRPLFLAAYDRRGAGAVIHSHGKNALLATLIAEDVFRCTQLEMMKGIAGVGYHDVLEVPIIENTAHECDLADALITAIDAYPKAHAVLVRRHGVYVWGKDWTEAKRHAECYDYLFGVAVEMKRLGVE
jgi:methylthioribulose-1-phosphate dehydratase